MADLRDSARLEGVSALLVRYQRDEAIRQEAEARLMAELERMRGLIRRMKDALSVWTDEGCDHSVGICMCDDLRMIEEADAILNREGC